MRFTIVSLASVDDALTELWLNAPDPQAVREAADWIERQLKNNPLAKVTAVDDAYFIRRDPLVALCRISIDDRLVTVIDIHRRDLTQEE
jgi:hypothetical protein